MKAPRFLVGFVTVFCCIACGDLDGSPTVSIDSLSPYDAVAGIVELQVTADMPGGVELLELWAGTGSEPVATAKPNETLTWNTMASEDGVQSLGLRVVGKNGDVANSEGLPVVVINHGQQADVFDFDAEAGLMLQIPAEYDGVSEVDAPHHWYNPANIKTIIAIAGWDVPPEQEPWVIGLTIGKGICPHRGIQYGLEIYSETSPVVLSVAASEEGFTTFPETLDPSAPETDWYFVHLRPEYENRLVHQGESVPYWTKIFLFE